MCVCARLLACVHMHLSVGDHGLLGLQLQAVVNHHAALGAVHTLYSMCINVLPECVYVPLSHIHGS